MTNTIEYELIRAPNRIRKTDAKKVDALVASIREVGLINPVTVAPAKIAGADGEIDGFNVVAGMHRFTALSKLGYVDIPCIVLDLGEQERIIAECDENLCVARLTPSDEALFTKRRKEAYLALHPETGHGKASPNKECKLHSFDKDQAAKTGKDASTVRRQASRGEEITESALALVNGTDLDTGVYLDKLKKVAPEDQEDRVRGDLARRAEKEAVKEAAKSSPRTDGTTSDDSPEGGDTPESAEPPRPVSPYASLTREALEDDHAGAVEEIATLKASLAKRDEEVERLKDLNAMLSSDGQGAIISRLERQRITLKGKMQDYQAATKREEFKRRKAEEERDAALRSLENQIIPL